MIEYPAQLTENTRGPKIIWKHFRSSGGSSGGLEDGEVEAEAQGEERSGAAGSFGDVPAGGAAVARSRSRPAASRSGGFVQGAGASVAVRIVREVGALGVAGAEDVTARERVQDVDDDVEFQADEGAVVVVDAVRRKRKRNRKSSQSGQWRCRRRCFDSIFRRLKFKSFQNLKFWRENLFV